MAQNIKISLQFKGDSQAYVLPVLPAQITINSPTGNESAQVLKLGEITILKRRMLRSLTIESFLPARNNAYPFCLTNGSKFRAPSVYLNAFERAQSNKVPAKISLEGTGINAFWVSIETFSFTQGVTGDIEYSLELKEFRPYGQRAKTMEQTPTLFGVESGGEVDSFSVKREQTQFAIGDRVLVSGEYFRNSEGGAPLYNAPANFLQQPFSAAALEIWKKRKDYGKPAPLNAQRCIIIDQDFDKVASYDLPLISESNITVVKSYKYHVADLQTRQSIGWVSEAQMRRID